jgi:hypothetical protein
MRLLKAVHSIAAALTLVSALLASCSPAVSTDKEEAFHTLENDQLEVRLRGDMPLVERYLLKENGGVLLGDVRQSGPGISFWDGAHAVPSNWTDVTYRSERSGSAVTYHAVVTHAGREAVLFDLIYTLTRNQLRIELKNVTEREGFYLTDILLPGLVTVNTDDGASSLAIGADAGRLINVGATSSRVYEYEIDWLNPILGQFAYNSKAIGIADTKSIENHSIVSVFEQAGKKFGSLSMRLMHRLTKYDLEEFGTVVSVTDPKKLLKVQDTTSVTITVTGDYDKDGQVSWVDGTKVVREGIDAVPNPYYRDKTFVRTFVDRPPTRRDPTGLREEIPFDSVLQRIKEFAAQTDSAACVMYLLGWQYEGHDSGYPSVDKVNENLGGKEALVKLIKEAKKYNVNVTFYDNYDDSYPNHPGWDEDVICRDPQGGLMKGGVWEGQQSYLISSYKYAVKSGLDRVKFTLDTYPVEKAYFIDVLSGGYNAGRKYDFNPESPGGAIKNFEGKLMIIEAFNKRGIDIATEDFSGYFVGHVGTFGNIIAFDNVYFENEKAIPLIPFIYHGKTSYGMKISDRSDNLRRFLYGHRAEKFTNKRTIFTPADYLLDALPKQKLYGKEMKAYFSEGDTERVVYEDGSVVEINLKADTYSVALGDGRVIARNYTSFVPMDDHTFLACSRDGGTFRYPVPAEWTNPDAVRVVLMHKDGTRESIPCSLKDGTLEFQAKPGAPYKVTYFSRT